MRQKFLAYHLGVQGRLGKRLNQHLQANAEQLLAAGIYAPIGSAYRPHLREYLAKNKFGNVADQAGALAAMQCPANYLGITLSNDQGLSAKQAIFDKGELLFWAENRIKKLANLFENHRLMFVIEVENFATFLPRLAHELHPPGIEALDTWELEDFSWADLIAGLAATYPEAEFVVVPTETLATSFFDIVAKMTVGAAIPKPNAPEHITREKIDALQLAIGANMAHQLAPDVAERFEDVLGWDEEARIDLSRRYYSEILALYQEHTVLL